jgi:hypothetical protein
MRNIQKIDLLFYGIRRKIIVDISDRWKLTKSHSVDNLVELMTLWKGL